MSGVRQRQHNDCGVAALASLTSKTYEEIETAWRIALGRGPGCSNYSDLLKVLAQLGIDAKKVKTTERGIRRARYKAGDNHSHWIVMIGSDGVWCPYWGWFPNTWDHPMPRLGHGIELV